MAKTITIDHKEISNPQTIADVQARKFKEAGVNINVNEVQSLNDDHKRGRRVITVKNTKFFDMGRGRG